MGADPDLYHPVDVPRRAQACFIGQNYADRAQSAAALINAGVPVEVYGSGWGGPATPPAAGDRETSYLGRPQPAPGSTGGYVKVIREIIARDGVVAGTKRIAGRLAHRRSQRQHAALFQAHAGGPIPFTQMLDVFGRSEVCLNFSNVWADGQPGSRLIPHVRLRDFEAPMCRTCYLTGHSDEVGEFYDIGREIDTYRTTDELIDKTRFYLSNPDAAERLRDAGYQRARGHHTWTHRFAELFAKAQIGRN
jgi:spore maturation protein CgeB